MSTPRRRDVYSRDKSITAMEMYTMSAVRPYCFDNVLSLDVHEGAGSGGDVMELGVRFSPGFGGFGLTNGEGP